MPNRNLILREQIEDEEITNFINTNDIQDDNVYLVINGGTGLGKTSQTMTRIKKVIEKKIGRPQTFLIVESRTATVDQIKSRYGDQIGIETAQRIRFTKMITNSEIETFDWVIIDECHGLFSEASFAKDASIIAQWISKPRKQHILFITANDEYFKSIAERYFPKEYNFIYLFKDFTNYYSPIYVNKVNTITTNFITARIYALLPQLKNKKGVFFLKRASSVKDWYFRLLQEGFEPAIMVSAANETNTALTEIQQKQLQDREIDYSKGRAGLTMADLCTAIDARRVKDGKEPIRPYLTMEARIPDDIDILLATDTIQEGVSIISKLDFILIEGYTEVEITQKLGRYRNNLDILFLLFNPGQIIQDLKEEKNGYDTIYELYQAGNQTKLAELYGMQRERKIGETFIRFSPDPKDPNKGIYYPNAEAYEDFIQRFHSYTNNNNYNLSSAEYARNLLAQHVKNPETDIIPLTSSDFHNMKMETAILLVAQKWTGIPLKGAAQEQLIADFQELKITTSQYKQINTFNKCINAFKRYNIPILDKQATKADLLKYPNYITKVKEKYKIVAI